MIGDPIEQMIGSVLNVALVAIAGSPGIINGLDRKIMVGDDIVLPEEDIQLIHLGLPMILMWTDVHIVENDIEIISPVVQFWYMGFLKCVIRSEERRVGKGCSY